MSRLAKIVAGVSHQDRADGAKRPQLLGRHLVPVAIVDRQDDHMTGGLGAALLSWADFDLNPRIIVDRNLNLVWANKAAIGQLSEQRDLVNRNGQLTCASPAQQQTLHDFLDQADQDISSLCLACEDGRGHLIIRAQRICESGARYTYGVTFYRSDSSFRARFVDLEKVFQLTRAEHETLLQLIEGHTAEETAQIKGVSIETIRSQIRQIYMKLNVKSREALFSRIRPFRI